MLGHRPPEEQVRADRGEVDLHRPGQPLRFGQRELIVHAGREPEAAQPSSPPARSPARRLYDGWKSMISGTKLSGTCRRRRDARRPLLEPAPRHDVVPQPRVELASDDLHRPAGDSWRMVDSCRVAISMAQWMKAYSRMSSLAGRKNTDPPGIITPRSPCLRHTPRKTSPFSKVSSPSASAPACTSAASARPGCIISSGKCSTTPIDEAMNGHASNIAVTLHEDGSSLTVDDDGRGIPVDKHPTTEEERARGHLHGAARRRQVRAGQLQDRRRPARRRRQRRQRAVEGAGRHRQARRRAVGDALQAGQAGGPAQEARPGARHRHDGLLPSRSRRSSRRSSSTPR